MHDIKVAIFRVYVRLMQFVTRKLFAGHFPFSSLSETEQVELVGYFAHVAQRSFDILYYDRLSKGTLSQHEFELLWGTMLHIYQRCGDAIFQRLSEQNQDPGKQEYLNELQRKVYQGATSTLFADFLNNKREEEDPYAIRLGAGFEKLQGEIDFKLTPANPQVTVIYPYRNRDPQRLLISIQSLLKSTQVDFEVIVADYGSNPEAAGKISKLADRYGFKHVHSAADGLPWGQGLAHNLGIQAAKTEYIMCTDMDMVFSDDVLKTSLDAIKPKHLLHCRPLWLDETGDQTRATLGDKAQLGGFLFMKRQELLDAGGFSEEVKFWGLEDVELAKRLELEGFETIWIDDACQMYHMWHPLTYGALDKRPQSSWLDSTHEFMRTAIGKYKRQSDFGVALTAQDRPILKQMATESPYVHEIYSDRGEDNYLRNYLNQFAEIVEAGHKHKFIKVELGARFTGVLATEFTIFNKPYQDYWQKYGVQMSPLLNKDFDYFYESLPILKEEGLVDYFLSPDYSCVYLLFS